MTLDPALHQLADVLCRIAVRELKKENINAHAGKKIPARRQSDEQIIFGERRMIPEKKISLRKAINDNCKNCIYDNQAAGTWLQQVTLCSVTSCSIYPVRPVTKSAIPESVLNYYSVTGSERERYALRNTRKGPFTEHKSNGQYLTTAEHESVAS